MTLSLIMFFVILAMTYIWYIIIIRSKNQVLEALSGIEVQLTKRHDLIPNILKIAKSFMEHEKDLITEVTALRAKTSNNYPHDSKKAISDYFQTNNEITSKMANLLLQVENYPNLKSDQTMLQAQMTYNEVEEHISAARRFYNAAVTQLNNIIQVFPGNLIAPLAKVQAMPFYQANEMQKQVIDANDILG